MVFNSDSEIGIELIKSFNIKYLKISQFASNDWGHHLPPKHLFFYIYYFVLINKFVHS